MKYHYVYKTTHTNSRYYIGRHTTDDLSDNYLGSGVWVVGVKDKSTLKKEILYFAKNTDDLKSAEEQMILENYSDPLCMNRGLGSNGWTSEEATIENKKRLLNGTHNFIGGEIPKRTQLRRVANGTHNFIGDRNPTVDRIKTGTHLWQSEEHKINTSINNKKRFSNGTHHFLNNTECPHCNKIGQLTAMKRWHFENCKNK